jgi:C-terminal processing protease CtpA/Prc
VCVYVSYVCIHRHRHTHAHTHKVIHHTYIQDNYIYVLKLVPGGPAQLCQNIEVDDVLYKVDGTNVSGMELDQVPFLSCI